MAEGPGTQKRSPPSWEPRGAAFCHDWIVESICIVWTSLSTSEMDFGDSEETAAPQFSAVPCRYFGLYKIYFIGSLLPCQLQQEQLCGGSSTLSSPHRVSKCSSSAQNPNYFIEHLAVITTCGSQNLFLTKVELKCGEPNLEENCSVGLWPWMTMANPKLWRVELAVCQCSWEGEHTVVI